MDAIDFQFEELLVTEAIRMALHGLDLVVRPLQGAGGDGVVVPGHQGGIVKSCG